MKAFYIFRIDGDLKDPDSYLFEERIEGTVADARKSLESDAHAAGQFIIAEDTSGIVTKGVETVTKTKVTFEPTRKRPRKEKKS